MLNMNDIEVVYSGKPEDKNMPTLQDLHDARKRWGTMAMSAILRCAEHKDVGMRRFLEAADATQRDLVGEVAKEFYAGELGLTEDTLETFAVVTALGITGAGFENEVMVESTENRCVLDCDTCPIIDHANAAGYENGHEAMADLSLWCDTYDNFESVAVSPTNGLTHSHCIGKGDKYCRIVCKTFEPEELRNEGEHIFDYTARVRDTEREHNANGPWPIDDLPPDLKEELNREVISDYVKLQSQIAPTLYERKQMGSDIWGRIAGVSTIMAGKLIGWDAFINSTPEKQGPFLQEAAKRKADVLGIEGDSVDDAVALHLGLIKGQGFGEYQLEKEGDNCVKGSCDKCPIVESGNDAGLSDDAKDVIGWCSAARTQEAQIIASDITHNYTHCLAKGDVACRWVIEKK